MAVDTAIAGALNIHRSKFSVIQFLGQPKNEIADIHILVIMVPDLHEIEVGADGLVVVEIHCKTACIKVGHQVSELQDTVRVPNPVPYIVATPITLKDTDELRMLL